MTDIFDLKLWELWEGSASLICTHTMKIQMICKLLVLRRVHTGSYSKSKSLLRVKLIYPESGSNVTASQS